MEKAKNGGREVVETVWAATSPVSGRFDPVETRSDLVALDDRFAALRARGRGYLEVRRTEEFPVLTVGFCGSAAVVQALTSPGEVALLEGDGSVERGAVEVPIMDETAVFAREAGLSLDHAWSVARSFLDGRHLDELGKWVEL